MRGDRPTADEDGGFTFVELMVVIFIIGLAASAIILAIPNGDGNLYAEADRFAARAKALRDNAIIESKPARIEIDGHGYLLWNRRGGGWQEAGRYAWSRQDTVSLSSGARGATRFDATGMATPVHLVLERGRDRATIDIGQDGSVHVRR